MANEIILPTERRKIVSYNPRLMVIYGKPKSGKSSLMASLDSNLIIDLEDGYRALSVMAVEAKNVNDMFRIKNAIQQKINETGKFPYRFITIDNATRLEEIAIPYAGIKYRKTVMGANWGFKLDKNKLPIYDANGQKVIDLSADVRTLPNGAGYLYLRQALKELITMFVPLCETLILVCHTKDKQITMNGEEQKGMDVDLCGKMSDIICGEADAIGYVFRSGKQTILSFEGGDNVLREARPLHLRGKRFVVAESDDNDNLKVDMSKIFINDGSDKRNEGQPATESSAVPSGK